MLKVDFWNAWPALTSGNDSTKKCLVVIWRGDPLGEARDIRRDILLRDVCWMAVVLLCPQSAEVSCKLRPKDIREAVTLGRRVNAQFRGTWTPRAGVPLVCPLAPFLRVSLASRCEFGAQKRGWTRGRVRNAGKNADGRAQCRKSRLVPNGNVSRDAGCIPRSPGTTNEGKTYSKIAFWNFGIVKSIYTKPFHLLPFQLVRILEFVSRRVPRCSIRLGFSRCTSELMETVFPERFIFYGFHQLLVTLAIHCL